MVFKQKTIHTNNALNLCILTYILCLQFPQFVTMPKTIRKPTFDNKTVSGNRFRFNRMAYLITCVCLVRILSYYVLLY